MKKFLIFLIAFALILSNSIEVLASPEPKMVQSNLVTSADQVNVGETVTMTAETLKQGSGYIEEWDGALISKSYFNDSTGIYVTEAKFTPTQAGTYTLTYTIKMHTGNNEVKFIGSASKTIEVIAAVNDVKSVIGLETRNVTAFPVTGADGTIAGYSVLGELYVLWNDNTSTLNGEVGYYFLPNEKSRVVDTTVSVDGNEYTLPVTISISQ